MSEDNGADTHEGNGSGKKDKRPELTASEIIIVAAFVAWLLAKFAESGGK